MYKAGTQNSVKHFNRKTIDLPELRPTKSQQKGLMFPQTPQFQMMNMPEQAYGQLGGMNGYQTPQAPKPRKKRQKQVFNPPGGVAFGSRSNLTPPPDIHQNSSGYVQLPQRKQRSKAKHSVSGMLPSHLAE